MIKEELNTWKEWGNYVLETLKRLEDKITKIEENHKNCELNCNKEIIALKSKAGIIGAITGVIVSGIMNLLIVIIAKLYF